MPVALSLLHPDGFGGCVSVTAVSTPPPSPKPVSINDHQLVTSTKALQEESSRTFS